MEPVLTISEIARRSGVASSALRFYEERGLIASERAGSGHRRFPRSTLRRIAFIVFAQRIGLTLDEIGAELEKLPADRVPTRRDWARLSGEWSKRIDQRIAELQRLKAGLTQCIGCGCLSIDRCRLANPLGPGRTRGTRAALLARLTKPALPLEVGEARVYPFGRASGLLAGDARWMSQSGCGTSDSRNTRRPSASMRWMPKPCRVSPRRI